MNSLIKYLRDSSWLELTTRWVLGVVFIYAGFQKLIDPAAFAKIIYGYDLFPAVIINFIAIVLPYIEFISGIALITGVHTRSAALIINGLLFLFVLILAINLIREVSFNCGCLSTENTGFDSSPESLLVRDIIAFIFGMQVLFFKNIRKGCLMQDSS